MVLRFYNGVKKLQLFSFPEIVVDQRRVVETSVQIKKYRHNPAHLFLDDSAYFITGAIYRKQPLLRSPALKELLLQCMQDTFADFKWDLQHWVILDNHYHLLGKSRQGADLVRIIRRMHAVSGYHIKQATRTPHQVWWNYWDYCLRDEEDYFTHLNYLLYNPVRHGYVSDLQDYPFSSFLAYLQARGRASLVGQFRTFAGFQDLLTGEDDF